MAQNELRSRLNGELYRLGLKPEPLGERVRRMQLETQLLACEHLETLRGAIAAAMSEAAAVRDGGAAYPAGARDQARTLMESLPKQLQALEALRQAQLDRLARAPKPAVWLRP
jgi:hypothetical protein